jgi:3-hydroxyacyl-CoA dehydrogenase
MGHGIAQVSAQAGYQVVAVETSDAALAAGMKRIDGSLSKVFSKEVAAGKITEVLSMI